MGNIGMDQNLKLLLKVDECRKRFTDTKYESIINNIYKKLVTSNDTNIYIEVKEELKKLPSDTELMEQLLKKLENKSIHKTLKKITEGKTNNVYEIVKGVCSLGTHIAIEIEHGNYEYKPLLFEVYHKLGKLLYDFNGYKEELTNEKS